MALRISKNRIHVQNLKNLCKRLLTTQHETITSNDGTNTEPNPTISLKEIREGAFRYKVCTDRSTPIERPPPSYIIESQYQKHLDAQHLQPAMLPTFYQKDTPDIRGNIKIKVRDASKKNTEATDGGLSTEGLQVSKTYSTIQLPLKTVRLAPPFPEPVKIMDSSKVSDEEKAEMMLREARSSKMGNLQPQLPRRNYSSLAHKKSQQDASGSAISAGPATLMSKSTVPKVNRTEQAFFSTVKKVGKTILSDRTNVLSAPGVGGPSANFFSQNTASTSTGHGPTILNMAPPNSTTVKNTLQFPKMIPKIYAPPKTSTAMETTNILPKVSIAPQRTIGFKIKKLETTRTYASKASRNKRKVDDCGRQKCEKVPKKTPCPKMCLPGCPPPNPNTACHPLPKVVCCTKQEAPYPAYSEFCHEDIDEPMTECNMCPWANDLNPNFKPQKKRYHTSSSLVKNAGATLGGASLSLLNYINHGTIDYYAIDKKPPCQPPRITTCAEREEQERLRQEKKKKKNNKLPSNEKKPKEGWTHFMHQHLLNLRNCPVLAKNTDGCQEELDIAPCGPCNDEPKCKKIFSQFPFPTPPPIKKEDKCAVKKKKKIVQDCPPTCSKVCQQLLIVPGSSVPGTSIVEPVIVDQAFKKFANKKEDCNKDDKKSTRPKGPPDDPCCLKKEGLSERCPKDLLKRRPGARKKGQDDD